MAKRRHLEWCYLSSDDSQVKRSYLEREANQTENDDYHLMKRLRF